MNVERPVKVLHVLGQLARGGAELRTLDVMRRIDRTRYQLDFCCLSGLPGPLDDEALSLGAHVHLLKLGARFPLGFLALLRREKYKIVHAHVHYSSGAILALAALAGVTVRIAHFRNTSDGRSLDPVEHVRRAILKAMLDQNATVILGVCEGALASAWSTDWSRDQRCKVVYNGLDLGTTRDRAGVGAVVRRELGLTDGPVIIHVGRMAPAKNHARLLEMFAHVRRCLPNAQLLLMGRGDDVIEPHCRTRAAQLGLGPSIRFLGERNDVPRLLAAADLMIFPSLWEGLPGAVLEALAAGVPVLASDTPGLLEIAARADGLVAVSLDATDEVWASHAVALLRTRPKVGLAQGGPFDVETCARQLATIWAAGRGQ